MKKFIFLLIGMLFLVNFVSADIGTYKQNSCIDIKTTLNTSSTNLSSLSFPNSTLALSNKLMTKDGFNYNYTFCNTNDLGQYNYNIIDSNGVVYDNSFVITSSGELIDFPKSILFISILIFFTSLFLLSLYFVITLKVDYQIIIFLSIAYLILILLVYLLEQISLIIISLSMFSGIMSTLLITLIIGLFPLIIGEGLYLIYNNFANKKTNELKEMGYSDDEVRRYR